MAEETQPVNVVGRDPLSRRLVNRLGTARSVILIVGVLLLASVVGMAGCIGPAVEVDGYHRMPVPDRRTLTVDDPGEYTLYHEYDGASPHDDDGPKLTKVEVHDAAGQRVVLRSEKGSKAETFGGHDFYAVYSFHAEKGEYIITADGDPATLAIGKDRGLKFMFLLLLPAFGLVMVAVRLGHALYLRRTAAQGPDWWQAADGRWYSRAPER